MQCLMCQADNASNAKFCNQCAAPFAPTCSACGHENTADAKFCNQCAMALIAPTSASATRQVIPQAAGSESRFHSLLRAVIALLQRERRVTYRELKYIFLLNESEAQELGQELILKALALEEEGKLLVWVGDSQATPLTSAIIQRQTGASEASLIQAPAIPASPLHATSTASLLNESNPSAEDSPTEAGLDEPIMASAPVRTTPDAERRQLTVMFCDLVGSTDLSGKLDPEDLRDVVRAYQETAAEVIKRYDGHIAQYLGDGLLIYFGFPVAHEDDAQRATYTGLGIPKAIAALNTRLEKDYGIQLAVRIGIHTGPVVVGEMGSGGRRENLALGETPNIAARLEGLAQANTAVISPSTAQLVQRAFDLEELGLHRLKGVAEPMMLYTVIRPRGGAYDGHENLFSGGFDKLVGRDEEIGLLLRRWEQSKDGLGQVILLSGEAGIGKSSLVDGLCAYVRQEGLTRIAFRCSPYHTSSAFYPIIDHLQRVLGWQPEDTIESQLAKLEQALDGTSLPLAETVPVLSALLSLPLPEGRYPALTLSPQQQRQQTQDILVTWLLEKAERQAMVAVWEDLHWSDPSTLETLGLLVEQAPTATMLHLLTFRPEFEPPWPMRSHLTPIVLNRLERHQVEGFLTQLAGRKLLPVEVVEHIVAKTDGVPLYIEELTKMLLNSDLLREEAEQYVLTGSLLSVSIPDTLQASLMARLDQMHTAKEAAQLGAILGREFSYEMLAALSARDDDALQADLVRLVEAELLYQRGRPPRAKYIFKHALIQDAAYASLLRSTRQQAHQQVARILEGRFHDGMESEIEVMAYHFMEANLPELAFQYWRESGQKVAARSANREAVACFEQALLALRQLPNRWEWREHELALLFELRETLFPLREFSRSLACLEEAEPLAEALDDRLSLGRILCFQGLHAWLEQNNHAQTRRLCERALVIAEPLQDIPLLALARDTLGRAYFSMGEYTRAMEIYTQNIELLTGDLEHQRLGSAVFASVSARQFYSRCCAEIGQFADGQQRADEAIRIAESVNHPHSLIVSCWAAGYLALRQGCLPRAIETLERAVSVCRKADIPLLFRLLQAPLGYGVRAYRAFNRSTRDTRASIGTDRFRLHTCVSVDGRNLSVSGPVRGSSPMRDAVI